MSNEGLYRRSWVEINLLQLIQNLNAYMSVLPSNSSIMAVVKANAYGHGDTIVAKHLEKVGISLFAVSNIGEAIALRQAGINGEILVLGYTSISDAFLLEQYDITQALISEEYAEKLSKVSSVDLKCQFAIDTGMNRIGLNANDVEYCEKMIRTYANKFCLNGLFTHLCVADSLNENDIKFTNGQIKKFEALESRVSDLNLKYIHCLNSAGGLSTKSKCNSIVRLGIVLYGLQPSNDIKLPKGIFPVLQWKSVISMIKTVEKDEFIGYGCSYHAIKDMRVATIPTGYADGYNRLLSNKGYVLISGQKAPIVGKICMDQMMVDVSNISDVVMGDEVVLIGKSKCEMLTADYMASMIDTIGYEIVCNISPRVERVYI